MRTVAIIQARMGSSRMPGKVLGPLMGQPMLIHIVERVRQALGVSEVVVATSERHIDEPIRQLCAERDIASFSGSETDVLDRFYKAASQFDAETVLRITADCPLADPQIITELLALFSSGEYDYVSVAAGAAAFFRKVGRYPDGLSAECMPFNMLQRAWLEAKEPTDREHVTPFLWRQPGLFRTGTLTSIVDYASLRLTVDNKEDFVLIESIYEALYKKDQIFSFTDVIAFLDAHPELAQINQHYIGKEGYSSVWHPERI